jgi:hypothetical protein
MTEQLEVSILAAPLAAIDRRTLSEAWYCALRLARDERSPAAAKVRAQQTAVVNVLARPRNEMLARSCRHPATSPAKPAAAKTTLTYAGWEARNAIARRSSHTPLARRIERVFSKPSAQVKRATFAIGDGRARVHVILQTNGGRATLVAICRPEARVFVARALAQARLILAIRGIGVELETKGVSGCS